MGKRLTAYCLWFLASMALADTWFPPTPKTFTSSGGNFRLTVFPRAFAGNLPYFEDKVAGRSPAAQEPGKPPRCEATLEQLDGNSYRELWRKPLINDVAPLDALVSDRDGAFITFDNWHFAGMGDDAIAIYDGRGELRKQMSLEAILTRREFAGLPRSISSIWWSGRHRLTYDARTRVETVELQIAGSDAADGKQSYFSRRLDLRTGELLK